jgi:hypothetical protein
MYLQILGIYCHVHEQTMGHLLRRLNALSAGQVKE